MKKCQPELLWGGPVHPEPEIQLEGTDGPPAATT
jgi:hypothetical protein